MEGDVSLARREERGDRRTVVRIVDVVVDVIVVDGVGSARQEQALETAVVA